MWWNSLVSLQPTQQTNNNKRKLTCDFSDCIGASCVALPYSKGWMSCFMHSDVRRRQFDSVDHKNGTVAFAHCEKGDARLGERKNKEQGEMMRGRGWMGREKREKGKGRDRGIEELEERYIPAKQHLNRIKCIPGLYNLENKTKKM